MNTGLKQNCHSHPILLSVLKATIVNSIFPKTAYAYVWVAFKSQMIVPYQLALYLRDRFCGPSLSWKHLYHIYWFSKTSNAQNRASHCFLCAFHHSDFGLISLGTFYTLSWFITFKQYPLNLTFHCLWRGKSHTYTNLYLFSFSFPSFSFYTPKMYDFYMDMVYNICIPFCNHNSPTKGGLWFSGILI